MNHDWTCGRGRSRHPPVNRTDDQKIAALMRPRQPQTVCLAGLLRNVQFREPESQGEPRPDAGGPTNDSPPGNGNL
ncbi:hypothetical protein JTE90_018183 [Oedothorax gibbosus]|uniref:Uncharacterized protein n=1 Tax=Oedothorax gibbosus TaxID=931172 RepID=A0AAV6UA77_9ARAC|nr:hypothetical protein JTE90_018183 [Oedothorax gibbosus]